MDEYTFMKAALQYMQKEMLQYEIINAVNAGWKHNVVIIEDNGKQNIAFQNTVDKNIRDENSMIIMSTDTSCINKMLENGYQMKYFDLDHPQKSTAKYNPFHYIKNEWDIKKFVNQIIYWTSDDKERKNQDMTWWQITECYLLCAMIGFMCQCYPESRQTMENLKDIIRKSEPNNDTITQKSKFDVMAEYVKETNSGCEALRFYDMFCQ